MLFPTLDLKLNYGCRDMENRENRTIETLSERLKELIAMIEDGAAPEAVLSVQRSFSSAVEDAKKRLDEGKIEVQVKGLPADMHLFATRDLPEMIEDENQRPRILKDLKRFMRVMELVVEPTEGC